MLRSSSLLAILGGLFLWPTCIHAIQDSVDNYVSAELPGLLVIHEPATILDQVEASAFFQNRHYIRAIEILTDDRFTLGSDDRMIELENKWYEVRDALAQIDEITIVLHSWGMAYNDIPQFTVVIAGATDANQAVDDGFTSAQELLTIAEDEEPDFFSNIVKSILEKLTVRQVGDYVLLSNAPEEIDRLAHRIENGVNDKFRSLAKHRPFQQVQNILDKKTDSPTVRGYLKPQDFPRLMSQMVDQDLWGAKPESLAGGGFQVVIQDDATRIETPDGNYQSVLNWEFVSTFTQPATGFGKIIESYKELGELPPLPFHVTTLKAQGFDQEGRFHAREEIYKLNEMEEYFNQSKFYSLGLFQEDKDVDLEALLPAFSESIEVFHKTNLNIWGARISFERVNDAEAMAKLFEQRILEMNKHYPEDTKLIEVPNDYGRLFARSEAGIRRHLKEFGMDDDVPDSGSLSDEVMAKQQEYFLNDEWMIQTDHVSMRKMLAGIYDEAPEPRAFTLLYEAARENYDYDTTYKIDYRSSQLVSDNYEQTRIWKKHMDDEDPLEMSSEERDALQKKVFDLMTAKPNEYGLRINIESDEDATAAVQQLLATALNETLGTSIRLYSSDEHRFLVFGQIYSVVE